MKYFPLFHRIENKTCLIVGGGKVALRRARALVAAEAKVEVIAPEISDELQALIKGSHGKLSCMKVDVVSLPTKYLCIIAATNDREVNAAVTDFAKANRIPVNVADNQAVCDFIFPSIVDRQPLTVAISNNGTSPVLSRLLKQQIEAYIPAAFGELSQLVGDYREHVKTAIPDGKTRKIFWEHVLQGPVAEAVYSGKSKQAEQLLQQALQSPEQFNLKGEVYLIGAGPGDPDLLTLRAFRLLQQADVVLYDRLVSDGVMALIKHGTELIYVGKRRNEHSVPQGGINQLLVEHAKKGKRVARLKGGDPFIFGRGGEEIETLVDEGVPFQVVPGITAANGCSAYAGIPLTHRDYAQSVQFVTGQLKDGTIDLNWQELIVPGKTLVFYMGLKGLPVITQSLIENGMAGTMPVALIEKGTTKEQRVLVSTLKDLPDLLHREKVASPSLFIVGEVVQLASKLDWYEV
ncbi:MAG: uroporphyrin-III C-methyltransferase/precorrin-2 dehydrogenase/sirohydrochlorin ferrochelatase [Oceanicoccus sp.]|jgi:uroporphyrin-III C-methyltransferase/precorrin-2 dehydrogenase/sirohydrochlorin ferrochelatase